MLSSALNDPATLSPEPRTARSKCPQPSAGFDFPADQENALYCIWQTFKTALHAAPPAILQQERCRAVRLMMQCHRVLKLPIETLYLSISIFDKVLITNYGLHGGTLGEGVDIDVLGLACLYSCQKLEKIRNYGVSYWLKHLSPELLASLDYPGLVLSAEELKRYQAYIMESMDYNLFSSSIFDILLGVWTLKPPTEMQFYFSQYLLELSLFVDFTAPKAEGALGSGTATSTTDHLEALALEDSTRVLSLDIVLAILSLAFHFVGKGDEQLGELVKTIWSWGEEEEHKRKYESKMRGVEAKANLLFDKVVKSALDPNCRHIVTKYGKQVNMGISSMKFISRAGQLGREFSSGVA